MVRTDWGNDLVQMAWCTVLGGNRPEFLVPVIGSVTVLFY